MGVCAGIILYLRAFFCSLLNVRDREGGRKSEGSVLTVQGREDECLSPLPSLSAIMTHSTTI